MIFNSECNNSDTQTVISDITDNDIIVSNENFEDKLNEIKIKFNADLNKLTMDNLKDKCKELGVLGISKFKKPELIQTLETEFFKMLPILKEKKVNELKNIYKLSGLKRISHSKKETIIYQILSYYSTNMIFKIDETKTQNNEIEESINKSEPLSLFEQLEKQKNDIELRMKEEIKKQEEERLKQEEEKRKIEEEEKRNLEAEEKRKIEEEKKENKKKKQSIPKNVRIIIWNHYIGEDIIKHKCLCCKKVTISNTNFEVGHVLSEKNGGTHEINNLRPICFSCNHSMGPENMVDFVVKYGLYIG
jgi:5-methylcytosine-specific restriction endonuclease McrA